MSALGRRAGIAKVTSMTQSGHHRSVNYLPHNYVELSMQNNTDYAGAMQNNTDYAGAMMRAAP
jgi:hypothetical protein